MTRLYLDSAREGPNPVDGRLARYLRAVLRLASGAHLEVFDGRGHSFPAKVLSLDASSGLLELGPGVPRSPPRRLTVLQGVPKGDKLELVIQKATELGATAFVPLLTERCVVRLAGRERDRVARWQRIAEEASRQCGRSDVPVVHAPCGPVDGVAHLPPGDHLLVLDEEERQRTLGAAVFELLTQPAAAPAGLGIVIGPEGGLTRDEVSRLRDARGVPVTLGPLVLRTETAALAAVAVIRHLDGDLG